jgi:DNA-binding NtrC family response regulator
MVSMTTERNNLQVCVLNGKADQVELATSRLSKAGYALVGTPNFREALQKVRLGAAQVVLADLKMTGIERLAFLERTLQYHPGMYVILVTGCYSVDSAIEAVKRDAHDCLCKSLDFRRLLNTLDELADLFARQSEIRNLEGKLFHKLQFHGIVGRRPAMLEVFELAKEVARHYANELVALLAPTRNLLRARCTG